MSEDYPCEFFIHRIEDETDKALYLRFNTFPPKTKHRWLPKSQLKEFSDRGVKGYRIPAWLRRKKGLIQKRVRKIKSEDIRVVSTLVAVDEKEHPVAKVAEFGRHAGLRNKESEEIKD